MLPRTIKGVDTATGLTSYGSLYGNLLDYVISALADAGISEVVLVAAPGHDEMRDHYSNPANSFRTRVRFSVQEEPRGTADAVLAARSAVRDARFLMLNSDNYYPVEAYRTLAATDGAGLVAFEATPVHFKRMTAGGAVSYLIGSRFTNIDQQQLALLKEFLKSLSS